MTEKTFDCEDPRDLPYRIADSKATGEVYILTFYPRPAINMIFENRESYHRFRQEVDKADTLELLTNEELEKLMGVKDGSS